jgi:hypothetical protein
MVLPILHISPRGYYRPNAQGEQPLTEDVLVETIRHMNNVIFENDQLLRNARAARDIAQERVVYQNICRISKYDNWQEYTQR